MDPEDIAVYDKVIPPLVADHLETVRRQQSAAHEQLLDASKSFDRTVITLAAGAIAGSVSFVERVSSEGRSFMIVAWVCLALSLLAILVSYHMAVDALSRVYRARVGDESKIRMINVAIAQRDYVKVRQLAEEAVLNETKAPQPFSERVLPWLNRLAIALLMLGVTLLLIAALYLKAS